MLSTVEAAAQAAADDPGGDAVFVTAAKRDPDAFALLYQRYERRIYAYCLRRIGDPSAAEDATSQIFARAFARSGSRPNCQTGLSRPCPFPYRSCTHGIRWRCTLCRVVARRPRSSRRAIGAFQNPCKIRTGGICRVQFPCNHCMCMPSGKPLSRYVQRLFRTQRRAHSELAFEHNTCFVQYIMCVDEGMGARKFVRRTRCNAAFTCQAEMQGERGTKVRRAIWADRQNLCLFC
jgi:hypothetical protein